MVIPRAPKNGTVYISQDPLRVPLGGHVGLRFRVAEEHHHRVSRLGWCSGEDAAEAASGGVLYNGVWWGW